MKSFITYIFIALIFTQFNLIYSQEEPLSVATNYNIGISCGSSQKIVSMVPVSYDWTQESIGNFEFPSKKLVLLALQRMNQQFNVHQIYFHHPLIIDSLSKTSTTLTSFINEIITLNSDLNAVFGLIRIHGNFVEGYAYRVPNHYFTIDGLNDNIQVEELTVMSHEMGHCLGLYHTYFQPDVAADCEELVDRSNCYSCGDYLCDTPADHRALDFNYNSNCEFILGVPPLVDANQDTIIPDLTNIMSYYPYECRTKFTEEQALAMHCMLDSSDLTLLTGESITKTRTPLTISGNYSIEDTTDIFGDIIIESGGTLTISSYLRMPFFGQIIVKNGGTLVIEGGHITSYTTGQFWQGIIVEGTGQTSGNGLLVLDGATLEHARLAVFSDNGGRLNAENSTFKNNKKSVDIYRYRRPLPNKITNCTFVTNEELFDVAWHVPLWDSTVLELKGEQNFHPDHDFFIQARSSNLTSVSLCNFISTAALDSSRYGTGINLIDADMAISNCHFENQRFGISKHNTWPGGKGITNVRKNSFENCRWSILLDGGDFTRIVGNTFRIPHDIDTFQIAAGIVNLGSNAVQIKDGNSFAASDANNSFFIYSDKLVDQHASEITRNNFGRADSSSWRQVELQGAQDSLQIFCNSFSLSAGTDFAIGLDTLTTLMIQGTPERPAGNDWSTLESCILGTNDESHIYSDGNNDPFDYIGFSGRVPDCVSHNVDTSSITESQDPTYCNIEVPCPECGIEIIDSLHLVIDTLIRNPPWGMSQDEIDQRVNHNIHSRNLKVQDILIDYIEQDSIDKALTWLDSVAIRTSAYDSIRILLQERYDQTPQRPGLDKSNDSFRSIDLIEVITHRKKEIKRITPLTKTKNSPLKSENITNPPIDPLDKLFIIFPNPAQSAFTIRLISSAQAPIWKFKVRDIHGRVILASSFVEGNEVNVDAWQWTGGIYFIEINLGDLITHMARVVILD